MQVSSLQVHTGQLSLSENDSTQVNPIQLSSTAFTFQPIDLNSTEISLSSSIAIQQLLTGYQRTTHGSNLQKTTNSDWTQLLQINTLFSLNVEMTKLPTGQLAEATITWFDADGRPSAGTIYIDDDANGQGWFIDPSPWDSNEFGTQNTGYNLQATQDSAAYGRYDLLTTILHELGHLAGFIQGDASFDHHVK